MSERYEKFSANPKFFQIKANLEKNSTYSGKRYLDMKKKTGQPKKYYSTEIFKEFDKHYSKAQ